MLMLALADTDCDDDAGKSESASKGLSLMLMKLIYDVSPCAAHLHHVSHHSRIREGGRF